jgi:branched-subunit amino acid transport protein
VEVRTSVLLIIVGCGLVTVIPRILPLAVLSRFTLPDPVVRWLGWVPVAVLAALLAQTVTLVNGQIVLPPQNLTGVALVPALVVAVVTRGLMGTVLVGVAAMAILRLVSA